MRPPGISTTRLDKLKTNDLLRQSLSYNYGVAWFVRLSVGDKVGSGSTACSDLAGTGRAPHRADYIDPAAVTLRRRLNVA